VHSLGPATLASLATVLRSLAGARRPASLAEPVHELRGALAAIALGTSVIGQRSLHDPGLRSALDALEGPIARAEAAIAELDEGGGRTQGRRPQTGGTFDLRALLHGATSAWSALAPAYGGSLELDWRAGDALVAGEPAAAARALDNLLANALEHGGGRVLVEGSRRHEAVVVTVSDSGPGPRAALARARIHGLARRRPRGGLQIACSAIASLGGRLFKGQGRNGPGVAIELPLTRERRNSSGAEADRAEHRPLNERRNGSVQSMDAADGRAA
jgi:C4-dicarboxylate-specific signal transduction histidine kinase